MGIQRRRLAHSPERFARTGVMLASAFAMFAGSGPGVSLATGNDESAQVASRASADTATAAKASDPIAAAKQAIADCRSKFEKVRDYTCTFVKRERLDGRVSAPHIMEMKARSKPSSVYLKFRTPNQGREAIYVAGRNKDKVLAHDVGIGKLLAGTMVLDPRGEMAMEDCRHPITEAGLGALIETVAKHWNAELSRGESLVTVDRNMRVGAHGCTMIEAVHPSPNPRFLYHKVRLFISQDHGLPVRYEAYDWPARPGSAPELIEEYTYLDVKFNVGLRDGDFDPENEAYSFGRF